MMNLEELTKGKPLKLTEKEVEDSLIRILGHPEVDSKNEGTDSTRCLRKIIDDKGQFKRNIKTEKTNH